MAIRVTCPNPGCGKILTIGDQFAGRTGKCPACGTTVKVPAASGAQPKTQPRSDPENPPPRSRPAAVTQVIRPVEPEADWEVVDDEPPPQKAAVAPITPKPASPDEVEIVSPDEVEIVENPGAAAVPASRSQQPRHPELPATPRRETHGRPMAPPPLPLRSHDEVDEDGFDAAGNDPSFGKTDENEWKPKWPLVRIGILITFIGTCILIGGLGFQAISCLVLIISFAGNSVGGWEAAAVLYKTGIMIAFLALIPVVVGYAFGIFTQPKYGALGLAIAATALGVVYLVLDVTFKVVPAFTESLSFFFNSVGGTILIFLISLAFVAQHVVFTLFLRSIYLTAKNPDRAAGCLPVTYFFGVAGGIDLLIMILSLIAREVISGAWFYIVIMSVFARFGVVIGGLSSQLWIMWQLRKTIHLRLIRRAAAG